MKRNKGSNQFKNRWGFRLATAISIWQIIAFTLFGVIISLKLQPKIISPLADNPFLSVYAAENTPKYDVPLLIKQITGKKILLRIAGCESNYRQNAISHTNDWGVFQINLLTHAARIPGRTLEEKRQWLLDPRNNILFAYNLYLQSGTSPWKASQKCWK